jgi:dihydrofolate synthase/folylpolyglutamate synthase
VVTVRDDAGRARGDTREYAGLAVPSQATYQAVNAGLAVAASHYLMGELDTDAVRRGLAATAVPGRLQLVRRAPLVLADGAHNPHGTAALVASLEAVARPRPRVALLSILRDKAFDEMIGLLMPLVDRVVCTCSSEPRSLRPEELEERVVAAGVAPEAVETVVEPADAYRRAVALAGRDGSVLVTGSLYLLEELADELSGPGEAPVY